MNSSDKKTGEDDSRSKFSIPCEPCFDDAHIGIVITTLEGRALYCNKTLLNMMGYSKEEARNISTIGVYKKLEDRNSIISSLRNREKIVSMETELFRKSGETIRVRFTSVILSTQPDETILSMLEDITQSRRIEENLAMHETAIASSICAIAMTDFDGNLIYVNPACLRLLGYTDPAQVLGKPAMSFVLSWDEAVHILSAVRTSGAWFGELTARRSDGKPFDILLSANVVQNKEGRPAYLMASFNDITDRKRLEEALAKSEKHYRDIFENASEGIFQTSHDGRLLRANAALAKMSGYGSPQEMIDSIADLGLHLYVNPDDRKHMLRMLKQWGKLEGFEVEMRRKDGTVFWVSMNVHTVRDAEGNILYFEGTNIDITARKQAEQELRRNHEELSAAYQQLSAYDKEIRQNYGDFKASQQALKQSEENYRQIFENSIEGIHQTTPEGRYLRVNPAFARMFGYASAQEMIDSVTEIGHSYVNPKDRKYLVQRLQKEDKIEGFEVERYRKDGSKFWISMNIRAVRNSDGKVLYFEGTNVDITERKRSEEERSGLELQLRQAQKMEAIGTMAGGIAHDFNNILMAMIGYTELAKDEEDSDNRDDCLAQVLKACERAKGLVNQILTFSRTREMEKQPVQINPVIKEGLKLLRSSIPSTIEIRQEIEAKPSVVIADPTQIHQILMNLGTNASHAMREKGGILDVSLIHERIDKDRIPGVPSLASGWYAKLIVRDTGHGIDPVIMDRIFEPFFTTKQQGEGTGLGMSVVYGIVRSCGGAIDVFSEPGNGTTISVYLPLAESFKATNKDSSAEIHGGNERILFIDDEVTLVDLGNRLLRSLGYQVTTRTSSIEALELFRARKADFDLVLTDMTMPNMTGAELAREMLAIRPDIPIILCTGYSEFMTEEKAGDLGIRGYIMKPLTRKDIGKAIHEALKSADK